MIVGGYAARMHGSARPTRDVDVAPATTGENLDRLAAALRKLDARIRIDAVPEGLPFATSGESLAGVRMLNLQTRHGELDLAIRPAAFEGGYDELVVRSTRRTVGGVRVRVAALEDVIRSKEAAARDKDIRALPELYRPANINRQSAAFPDSSQAAGHPVPEPVTQQSASPQAGVGVLSSTCHPSALWLSMDRRCARCVRGAETPRWPGRRRRPASGRFR
ncbi:hypothetical protein SAMN05661080_05048 [Modestobacter sp. DSM 44400]|uniref:hypothetical protein n=1 Tax=Modestobacter sp. DSM 44400 TaxID=1550230 RepID=UPI00089D0A28|nr:hypothetical protein [Modestobacter sp. DSM 44400]SDY92810.1 hypothetical protein SAMN05661080_05048 [Modestobacter sp. DSM 44400]